MFPESGILTKLTIHSKWYENMHEKKTTEITALLKKYLCDPVLIYTVVVMTSIMYHYRDTMLTAVYGLVTLVIAAVLFRLFDFMMKHKFLGTVGYLSGFVAFALAAALCMDLGKRDYPISFGLWFMTPQTAVEFNPWYTAAIFILFVFFMSSVIYYFTRVRYRIFMGFLIFIIPFSIYGKEAEQMPIAFIIIMAVGYIMLLIHFRQLKDSETVTVAKKPETWRSVWVYALLFAAVAAVVPKPKVDTDRSFIESLISAERFTDRLVAMLGNFRESSSGGQYRDVDNDIPLYYVDASEALHFKTSTFSTYDYTYDAWNVGNEDKEKIAEYDKAPVEIGNAGQLTKAILAAAELDSDFAEEYGLSGYTAEDITIPEERTVSINSVYSSADFAPVPQFVQSLTGTNSDSGLRLLRTGLIRSDKKFDKASTFIYKYYRDTFFTNITNKEIIDKISRSDYYELLTDAWWALSRTEVRSQDDEKLERYRDILRNESDEYYEYCDSLLDYGDSSRIYDLAQEITEGLDSDYDKAKAIEQYFYNNGFVYDLKYTKARGENVENFLFNSKRGVCFEYATSMVLLARAAGIPARYCEGYLVTELRENYDLGTNYVVTPKSAHGYPELYIEGFGWTTFEPTITDGTGQDDGKSLAEMLMIAGAVLFGILVLIFVIIKIYPPVYHRVFVAGCRKKSPADAAKAVMYRICRVYGISGVNTSHEAAEMVRMMADVDVSVSADLFDAAVYGEENLDKSDTEITLNAYIQAYTAYKSTKRSERKNKRKKSSQRTDFSGSARK